MVSTPSLSEAGQAKKRWQTSHVPGGCLHNRGERKPFHGSQQSELVHEAFPECLSTQRLCHIKECHILKTIPSW